MRKRLRGGGEGGGSIEEGREEDAESEGEEDLDGGHSGIVPSLYDILLDEVNEFPLGEHRMSEVETSKFPDTSTVKASSLDEPIVGLERMRKAKKNRRQMDGR